MDKKIYENYLRILEKELIPAMGCTEPIAIALCAARAAEVLGCMPEGMVVWCSGNMIKNVKGVNVPNAGGQKGIETAALLGALAGDPDLDLQVISKVPEGAAEEVRRLIEANVCVCELAEGVDNLYVRIEASAGADHVTVVIQGKHNHFSLIRKNGEVLLEAEDIPKEEGGDKSLLNVEDIREFADTVDLEDIRYIIGPQLSCNCAISEEGLSGDWGASVGKTLMEGNDGGSLRIAAAARAAAGSDARMSGCALPVVINSGSGNQGITVTMPVVTYAEAMDATEEQLLRALVFTNLIAIHQKRFIGDLSAYCGAVSAGTAAACGVAYLNGAGMDIIENTIINSLGTNAGIICDGAKSSCAAKIASAVQGALLGYEMAQKGRVFAYGEGLVEGSCEETIENFGRLGREGMKETDIEILHIMTGH